VTGAARARTARATLTGNLFVGTRLRGSHDYGDGELKSDAKSDAVLLSYAPDGELRFTHVVVRSGTAGVWSVWADAGRVFVSGDFEGALDAGLDDPTSHGGTDAFVLELDASGSPGSARVYGGEASDAVVNLVGIEGGGIGTAALFPAGTFLLEQLSTSRVSHPTRRGVCASRRSSEPSERPRATPPGRRQSQSPRSRLKSRRRREVIAQAASTCAPGCDGGP